MPESHRRQPSSHRHHQQHCGHSAQPLTRASPLMQSSESAHARNAVRTDDAEATRHIVGLGQADGFSEPNNAMNVRAFVACCAVICILLYALGMTKVVRVGFTFGSLSFYLFRNHIRSDGDRIRISALWYRSLFDNYGIECAADSLTYLRLDGLAHCRRFISCQQHFSSIGNRQTYQSPIALRPQMCGFPLSTPLKRIACSISAQSSRLWYIIACTLCCA